MLGLVFGDPDSAAQTGPLTEQEVRDVAYAFADAYAAEDPAALRATLARNVERTAPGGVSRGRDQVVDQYNRQFDGKVGGYELDIDEVQAGRGRPRRAAATTSSATAATPTTARSSSASCASAASRASR